MVDEDKRARPRTTATITKSCIVASIALQTKCLRIPFRCFENSKKHRTHRLFGDATFPKNARNVRFLLRDIYVLIRKVLRFRRRVCGSFVVLILVINIFLVPFLFARALFHRACSITFVVLIKEEVWKIVSSQIFLPHSNVIHHPDDFAFLTRSSRNAFWRMIAAELSILSLCFYINYK